MGTPMTDQDSPQNSKPTSRSLSEYIKSPDFNRDMKAQISRQEMEPSKAFNVPPPTFNPELWTSDPSLVEESGEQLKPRSLVEWSKTPEARASFLEILAKNEAKPSIYSPEPQGSEPISGETSNQNLDIFTRMKMPGQMEKLKARIDAQNAELTVKALKRDGLI